jgi:hypothetical protein
MHRSAVHRSAVHRAHRAVVGRVADLSRAREVFAALQAAGVDAAAIRLAGRDAEAAAASAGDPVRGDRLDAAAARHLGRRVVAGALAGALIGAVVASAAGGILLALDVVGGLVFVAIVVVAAIVGGTFATFASVERTAGYDDTWELTFDGGHDGPVWLVVRVADDAGARRARDVLTAEGVSLTEERAVEDLGAHTARW